MSFSVYLDTSERLSCCKSRKFTLERFIELLPLATPSSLKRYATTLLNRGVPYTSINSMAYEYIDEQRRHNKRRARVLARSFRNKPFYWTAWLENEI